MKSNKNSLVSRDEHLNAKYGEAGTPSGEKYEEDFKALKIRVFIQEARKKQNLTHEVLALKVGITKHYISRIENDASDIRLSTLMRKIREGLGVHLTPNFH